MKKVLLPEASENLRYYRANLHCHSTISDGAKTVEQLKADYMAHGYSVIAFTDHEVFITHNDLTDENFLAMNGYEFSFNGKSDDPDEDGKTCHICLVALDKNITEAVCCHRTKYLWGNAAKLRDQMDFDDTLPDFEREYTPECINEVIRRGKEGGFFVTYNHPYWSIETYPEYSQYEGMDAMEVINFGCIAVGYDDDNDHCYEELLRQKKRLYCIGTDDNHNRHDDENPLCDSYGGFTMIASPSLKYEDIAAALKNGQFYTSTGNYKNVGPEIKSIVYEDGKVTIKTSPCRTINYIPNRRACVAAQANDGEYITEARFDVKDNVSWFRFTAVDEKGYKAFSNAYFTDELK